MLRTRDTTCHTEYHVRFSLDEDGKRQPVGPPVADVGHGVWVIWNVWQFTPPCHIKLATFEAAWRSTHITDAVGVILSLSEQWKEGVNDSDNSATQLSLSHNSTVSVRIIMESYDYYCLGFFAHEACYGHCPHNHWWLKLYSMISSALRPPDYSGESAFRPSSDFVIVASYNNILHCNCEILTPQEISNKSPHLRINVWLNVLNCASIDRMGVRVYLANLICWHGQIGVQQWDINLSHSDRYVRCFRVMIQGTRLAIWQVSRGYGRFPDGHLKSHKWAIYTQICRGSAPEYIQKRILNVRKRTLLHEWGPIFWDPRKCFAFGESYAG